MLNAEGSMLKRVAVLIAIAMLPINVAAQSTHLLIVVGLAGDPEHGELFQKWGTTLADAHATAHALQDAIRARLRGADVLIHLEPEDSVHPGTEIPPR